MERAFYIFCGSRIPKFAKYNFKMKNNENVKIKKNNKKMHSLNYTWAIYCFNLKYLNK